MSSIKDNKLASGALTGRAYWRSLEELSQTPEFLDRLKREFPEVATEIIQPRSRRDFLKFMGASLALAGLAMTGCRWPAEKIAPYANRPEGFTPGTPVQYATAMELGGAGVGLLVTSFDGRPIKIEGNPDHPGSLGSANALHQASVLELYDPSRTKDTYSFVDGQAQHMSIPQRDEFLAAQAEKYRNTEGRGLALLFEETASPSVLALRRQLHEALPFARQFIYEPISRDNERLATDRLYNHSTRSIYHLDQAQVIACFDDDLLMAHPNAVRHMRDLATGRKVDGGAMNRLYAFESQFSLTGMTADHRLALRSIDVDTMVMILAAELFITRGLQLPEGADHLVPVLERFAKHVLHKPLVATLAGDLLANRGRCLVTAGARMSINAHLIVHLLNAALDNFGTTVELQTDLHQYDGGRDGIAALVEELRSGGVETLVIAGGNPVYNAPADLDLAGALGNVEQVIYLALHDTETTAHCTWQINRAHYLESWGDTTAWDGTYSIVQPLIAPLYGGLSEIELLARLTGSDQTGGYQIVRETFDQRFSSLTLGVNWEMALQAGLVTGSGPAPFTPPSGFGRGCDLLKFLDEDDPGGLELVLVPDLSIYDGRFANNGWLQELPDPVTKITWDNALQVSPRDADLLGIREGDIVELNADGRSLRVPVYVLPGQADGSLTLPLGYGRGGDLSSPQNRHLDALHPEFKEVPRGVICTGVGVSAYALRTAASQAVIPGVKVTRTDERHELVSTQDSHAIDMVGFKERERRVGTLIREANLDFYKEHPEFAQQMTHHPPLISMWKEHDYEGHRWGMAIDLNVCNGCSACIVACQAENNIPVVGRRRIAEGREMQWIRIDRYFSGDVENPQAVHQPLACHHCELAPCEQVCPVAATVHSSEGLNDMVYNRCVGTRYCANNCPYKVRRFNYFAYDQDLSETEKMKFNPEVTVRSRGVMEKCSYCVQRIQAAKIKAGNEGRDLADGEVTPACAQTCPARAITFGDLNDPHSEIHKMHADGRAYSILAELNIKPRTAYLAKVRNPAPGTPEHSQSGPGLLGGHGAPAHGAVEHDETEGHGDGH